MRYKNVLIALISTLFFLNTYASTDTTKGYKIKVNAPFEEGSVAYLANYWEGATYAIDSIVIPKGGVFTFENQEEELKVGQYLLYIKPNIQIDLLIGDRQNNITIELNKDSFIESKITGSEDTQTLWQYLTKLTPLNIELETYAKEIKEAKKDSEQSKVAQDRYKIALQKVEELSKKYISSTKGTWVSAFIKASSPLKEPYAIPANREELRTNANYIRKHYFDNMDLTDTRLWRTSFFAPQIQHYLREVIPQHPDTIAEEASRLVAKTKSDNKAFEKMLSYLVNNSTTSRVMGMENTWAKLAEDYIFDKHVSWIDSTQYINLRAEYARIEKNRIGMKAENLILRTIDGDSIEMYNIDADYLLLYFYSPTCSYCRKEIPLLREDFYEKHKNKGFKVLAVNVDNDVEYWQRFMLDNNMSAWNNAFDPEFKSQYWLKYDTSGTPSLYLLDKNKTILAKKLNLASLEQYVEMILR